MSTDEHKDPNLLKGKNKIASHCVLKDWKKKRFAVVLVRELKTVRL